MSYYDSIKDKAVRFYKKSKRTQRIAGKILSPTFIITKVIQEVVYRPIKLRGFPRALQTNDYTCGAQCVFAVLKWYELTKSFEQIKRELRTTVYGTGENQMKRVLRNRGLSFEEFDHKNILHLRRAINQNSPIIVSVDEGEHWAVVYGYSEEHIWIVDPSISRRRSSRESFDVFNDRWTGYGLIVSEE